MRVLLAISLLAASQPLLVGIGVLIKEATACGAICVSAAHLGDLLGSPRDVLLTALAVAAPYLLAGLVTAVTWLLAGRTEMQPTTGSVLAPHEQRQLPAQPEGLPNSKDTPGLPALT